MEAEGLEELIAKREMKGFKEQLVKLRLTHRTVI